MSWTKIASAAQSWTTTEATAQTWAATAGPDKTSRAVRVHPKLGSPSDNLRGIVRVDDQSPWVLDDSRPYVIDDNGSEAF